MNYPAQLPRFMTPPPDAGRVRAMRYAAARRRRLALHAALRAVALVAIGAAIGALLSRGAC